MRVPSLALATLTLAALPAIAQASSDVAYFKSPTNNIRCGMEQDERTLRNSVYCSTFRPTSNGQARVYGLYPTGRTKLGYTSPGLKNQTGDLPLFTLKYGETTYLTGGTPKTAGGNVLRCKMARDGITCRNRQGHGFKLRVGYARRF